MRREKLERIYRINMINRGQYRERTGVPKRAARTGWWMRAGPCQNRLRTGVPKRAARLGCGCGRATHY